MQNSMKNENNWRKSTVENLFQKTVPSGNIHSNQPRLIPEQKLVAKWSDCTVMWELCSVSWPRYPWVCFSHDVSTLILPASIRNSFIRFLISIYGKFFDIEFCITRLKNRTKNAISKSTDDIYLLSSFRSTAFHQEKRLFFRQRGVLWRHDDKILPSR